MLLNSWVVQMLIYHPHFLSLESKILRFLHSAFPPWWISTGASNSLLSTHWITSCEAMAQLEDCKETGQQMPLTVYFFLLWQFHQLQRIIPSDPHFSRADDAAVIQSGKSELNSAGSSLFLCYRLTTTGEKGGTRGGKEGVEWRDYGGKLPLR